MIRHLSATEIHRFTKAYYTLWAASLQPAKVVGSYLNDQTVHTLIRIWNLGLCWIVSGWIGGNFHEQDRYAHLHINRGELFALLGPLTIVMREKLHRITGLHTLPHLEIAPLGLFSMFDRFQGETMETIADVV